MFSKLMLLLRLRTVPGSDRVMPGELHSLRGARRLGSTRVPHSPTAEGWQWSVWRWMGTPEECLHGRTHVQAPVGREEGCCRKW